MKNWHELARSYGVACKERCHTFDTWLEFYRWYREVSSHTEVEAEGYVVEDASGMMVKVKLPYYLFWKQMSNLKDAIANGRVMEEKLAYSPMHYEVINWMKEKDRAYLRQSSIIQLRDDFLSSRR